MKRILGCLLVLLLASPALRADDKPQDKDKRSPQEQYDALLKQYSDQQQAYFKAMNEAKTNEERKKATELRPKAEKYAPQFLELAEKNRKDKFAVDALVWIVTNAGAAAKAEKDKAFEILLRDHVESERLGTVCQNLAFGFEKRNEAFLRAVMEKNPSKSVKAEACLALGQVLHQQANLRKRMSDDPKLADQVENDLGKDVAADLKKANTAKLEADSAAVFGEFVEQYAADVKPERIAQLCQRLSFSGDKGSQSLLRTLLEKDKRREVQGVACLALGQSLKMQSDTDADKDPKAAAKLRAESEAILERAAKEYGEVKLAFRGTVGEKAKSELYEIRHLAVGLKAPDVAGEDQDGKKFKLSDYQGKVVLLDFWSEF
jgi:hypothetical protein